MLELDYQDARRYIIKHPENVLQKAASSGYVCPCCGSGSGQHGTGIQEQQDNPDHFTCWAGDCFHNASVIDIVAQSQHLSPREAFFYCLDANQIKLAHSSHKEGPHHELQTPRKEKSYKTPEPKVPLEVIKKDIADAQQPNEKKYAYLESRGISRSVQDYFGVGYLERWSTPSVRDRKRPNGKPLVYGAPFCIIPTNKDQTSYLARDTRDPAQLNDKQKNYTKMKVGNRHEFNWDCLQKAKGTIFVTEGEIDAMSVFQAGQHQALAVGSVAYVNKFLDYVSKQPKLPVAFGIILDKDEPGRKANDKLVSGLSQLGYMAVDVSDTLIGQKDANDALRADRRRFSAVLKFKANIIDKLNNRSKTMAR